MDLLVRYMIKMGSKVAYGVGGKGMAVSYGLITQRWAEDLQGPKVGTGCNERASLLQPRAMSNKS